MSTSDSNSHDHPSELEEDPNEGDTGDSENGEEGDKKTTGGNAGRVVTLQSLLGAGVLEPGEGTMTIDYLGQKFTGDLLLDGKIKSQETEKIYASPTAWAQSCKKIVNPEKQSGCGWATVRYKGKKLDAYKSYWLKKQYEESCLANDFMEAFSKNLIQHERELAEEDPVSTGTPPPLTLEDPHDPELGDRKQRHIVRHSILGNRQASHDSNLLVESVTFSSLGKIQPFLISLTTNAALIIDFHCHLTTSEVVGYLAGTWDVNAHVLTVSHAFPLRCRLGDFTGAPFSEAEALQTIKTNGLTLLGWYHSHPRDPAQPSLRDIDAQLDYELRMKGNTDSAYIPCVGLICSPYNMFNASMESEMMFYWVAPPPESRIYEYGKPMTMNYTMMQDETMPHQVLLEMKRCADFYKNDKDYVVFDKVYKKGVTYLEKLKITTMRKYPRNQENAELLWSCIRGIATSIGDKPEKQLLDDMIAIANMPCLSPLEIEKSKINIPNLLPVGSPLSGSSTPPPPPRPHGRRRRSSSKETTKPSPSLPNYFNSDLASALFASANSFMGFDPATLSLLNLNSLALSGMFLPPMPPFKPDPGIGLMKPPPPPNPYNPYSSSRSSRSRSSSSSPSSSHRNSPSATTSASKDMPPPNKVPKIENNGSLGKNCTLSASPASNSSKTNRANLRQLWMVTLLAHCLHSVFQFYF